MIQRYISSLINPDSFSTLYIISHPTSLLHPAINTTEIRFQADAVYLTKQTKQCGYTQEWYTIWRRINYEANKQTVFLKFYLVPKTVT